MPRDKCAAEHVSTHPLPESVVWPERAIFTLGHSTLQQEDFIALLEAYAIGCLADIRTVPRSRHNPQFNSDTLKKALRACKLDYVLLPALGGLRHARKDSHNTGWRNASFRGFADYMQTPDFADGLEQLISLSHAQRTAIMCAEAVPWRCHRSLVADALNARGIPVIEILSATSYREHKMTPFAHVEGTSVSYPPEHPASATR
jgi:uncharacterized protein (DUF488 family)